MHSIVRVSAAALTAVAFGGVGAAGAAADGKAKSPLRLVAIEKQSEFVDLGTSGPSLGDQLVFSETLFRRGREVGDSGVVCTVTEVVAPYDVLTFHCVGTLSLPKGQITLQGRIEVQGEDDPGPFTVAITGGTGAYRAAGGQARIRDTSPTRTVYRLFLTKFKRQH